MSVSIFRKSESPIQENKIMIPSNRWFPSSLQERAAWFANFTKQFASVGASLGFTPAEVLAVQDDDSVFEFLASTAVQLDAFRAAVQQYRTIITEGNIGDPTPAFPANVTFALPGPIPTGIFQRLDDNVKRIRTATTYTDEIGALLGILPVSPTGPQPEVAMQPTVKTVTLPGSVIQVKFVRGNTDGVVIETKIDNADMWSDAGKFFKSPAELVIPENPTNLPRSVQIRARYVDGNTPVGQFSPIVTTATQPAG